MNNKKLTKKIIKILQEVRTHQLSFRDFTKLIFSFIDTRYIMIKKKVKRVFITNPESRAVFIVGNQRSGTSMLINRLGKHIDVDVYDETSNAMKALRIKSLNYIKNILEKTKAKIVIFKPLEDSHRVLKFLSFFDSSKTIWIFRNYKDVVNSSFERNWGKHCREYVENIVEGVYFPYCEPLNLSEQNVQLVRNIYHPSISYETCIAIIWYLRNTIYFDLNLAKNQQALLVCYENLVNNPEEEMNRILFFLGIKNKKYIRKGIHNKSVKKESEPIIAQNVKNICEKMYKDLVDSLPQ